MTDTTKIACPGCESAMNHHAVKIEYDTEEPPSPPFEGVLKNLHTCPACGAIEMTTVE